MINREAFLDKVGRIRKYTIQKFCCIMKVNQNDDSGLLPFHFQLIYLHLYRYLVDLFVLIVVNR